MGREGRMTALQHAFKNGLPPAALHVRMFLSWDPSQPFRGPTRLGLLTQHAPEPLRKASALQVSLTILTMPARCFHEELPLSRSCFAYTPNLTRTTT